MELIESREVVYGYRKLIKSLQKVYQLIIKKKKVYRLCTELDILMPQREKKSKVYEKKLMSGLFYLYFYVTRQAS
jgi:putative transposase